MIPPWIPLMGKPTTNLETTTHVASAIIRVGKRAIQRCLVCGEKLADSDDDDLVIFWGEGELVKAEYGFFHSAEVEYASIKRLPNDFCIQLVEA